MALLAAPGSEDLARKLCELCADERKAASVLATNAHHVLIGLLGAGPDCKTTECAIEGLAHLAEKVAASRDSLLQAGVSAPAVALLRTASNELTLRSAACLVGHILNRSRFRSTRCAAIEAFQKAGAIEPLVSLLSAAPKVARVALGTGALYQRQPGPDHEHRRGP